MQDGVRLAAYFHEEMPELPSAQEQAQLLEAATEAESAGFISMPVYMAFEKEMEPYFSGEKSFESCAKALQQTLKDYLETSK